MAHNIMNISEYHFFNFILVLIILSFTYKNNLKMYIGLFYYTAFHYSLGVVILLSHFWINPNCLYLAFDDSLIPPYQCFHNSYYKQTIYLHKNGFGTLIGIYSFLICFITALIILFNVNKRELLKLYEEYKKLNFVIYYVFSLFILIIFLTINFIYDLSLSYHENKNYDLSQNIKNIIFYIISLFLIVLGLFSFKNLKKQLDNIYSKTTQLSIIIFIPLIFAFIEVFWGLTFNFTLYDTHTTFRAASTFFNPNIYAVWLVAIFFVLSVINWSNLLKIQYLILPMFLTIFSIYLTGSRGVFLIFLFCMSLATILLPRNKFKFFPISFLIGSFLLIYFVFYTLVSFNIGIMDFRYLPDIGLSGTHALVNLGNRFFSAPIEIIGYLLKNIEGRVTWIDVLLFQHLSFFTDFILSNLKIPTILSLDLRFNLTVLGEAVGDSGWLNSIKNFGWSATFLILFQHLCIIYFAVILYINEKNIFSSIAINIQIFSILLNFTIKFYAFPIVIVLSLLQLFSILILINQSLKYSNLNR